MCSRLIRLASFVLVLGTVLTSVAKADLVAHWAFNEGSGGTAQDSSGSAYHGEVMGNPTWGVGPEGFRGALDFGVGKTVGVNCGVFDPTNGTGQFSVGLWAFWDGSGTFQHFLTKSNGWGADTMMFQVELWGAHTNGTYTDRVGISYQPAGSVPFSLMPKNEWVHLTFTFDGTSLILYLNGVDEEGPKPFAIGPNIDAPVLIGQNTGDARVFNGLLDDMQLFDEVLSPSDVQGIMLGVPPGAASKPLPDDGATDVSRDVMLGWTAGDFAPPTDGHVVYLSESFDDVNDASGGATQDAASYQPGRLTFDTTYYWRVDEVNGAPDFTVYKGSVWSFSTEPLSISIADVTATASSSFGLSTAENTINGSGLVGDLHGTAASDMWISSGLPATIEYAFDRVYKLHELWVWNSNQLIEAFVGFGAKDIVLEYSLDGVTWALIDGVAPLAQGPGAEGYAHNSTIDLGGASAQYIRLTVNSTQGISPQASLSEVRFFYIPTLAARPSPEDGASDVDPGTQLSWGRDGREAERHDVYLGTDPGNLSLAGTVTESGLDTGGLGLLLGETYHWRVDEVNDSEDPSVWEGNLWSFSTAESILIDDMESYADKEFLEIWATWIDGFEDPTNGALVGNGPAGLPETTITHSGKQSLPLYYDNSGAGLSEATRTFSPAQDWTVGAPETLVVHFQGALANSGGGQVYVKINNTKVTHDANPAALSSPFWTQWNIDLAGVDMVNSLTIGVEGPGAQGILYVDDLILYRQAPEAVGAQDPGTDNLVAYYPLDNNAQDGSGNGHHGTIEGSPVYLSPGWDGTGACMQFGPQDARITVESFDVAGSGITLSAWINPSLFTNDARMVSKSDGGSTANHYWAMVLSGSGENFLQFRLRTDQGNTTSHTSGGQVQADEWTHVAVTWDAADPVMREYINVQQVGSTDKAGTAVATGAGVKIGIGNQSISALAQGPGNEIRPFDGRIDEVRVYSRGLSVAELIHVAFGQ